jgi:hypothetical protein
MIHYFVNYLGKLSTGNWEILVYFFQFVNLSYQLCKLFEHSILFSTISSPQISDNMYELINLFFQIDRWMSIFYTYRTLLRNFDFLNILLVIASSYVTWFVAIWILTSIDNHHLFCDHNNFSFLIILQTNELLATLYVLRIVWLHWFNFFPTFTYLHHRS